MYKDKLIGVVVPAHNEEHFIGNVLSTMPTYVDKIIVVDDHSSDKTYDVTKSFQREYNDKLIIVRHEQNQGVGASCVAGYKRALEEGMDVVSIMAGDGQMPPADLARILDPVVEGKADYSKNNRLLSGKYLKQMPRLRIYGNSILSLLTKLASGYWHIVDSQSGYTAISRQALETIDLDSIYKKYGWCNDLLVKLNVFNFKVVDIPTKPVYGDEKSGIKLRSYMPLVSMLLLRDFFWRLKEKYIIRDFHPLILFYFAGILLSTLGLAFGIWIIIFTIFKDHAPSQSSIILCALMMITGMQSLFFAMLFDKQENDR
ncbi:glycosyltransferase family 2 protein [Chloroflexota bacterium]